MAAETKAYRCPAKTNQTIAFGKMMMAELPFLNFKDISNMIGAGIIIKDQVESVACTVEQIKYLVASAKSMLNLKSLTITLTGTHSNDNDFHIEMHSLENMPFCKQIKELSIINIGSKHNWCGIDLRYIRIVDWPLTKLYLGANIKLHEYNTYYSKRFGKYPLSLATAYNSIPIGYMDSLKKLYVHGTAICLEKIKHMRFDVLSLSLHSCEEIVSYFKDNMPAEIICL